MVANVVLLPSFFCRFNVKPQKPLLIQHYVYFAVFFNDANVRFSTFWFLIKRFYAEEASQCIYLHKNSALNDRLNHL